MLEYQLFSFLFCYLEKDILMFFYDPMNINVKAYKGNILNGMSLTININIQYNVIKSRTKWSTKIGFWCLIKEGYHHFKKIALIDGGPAQTWQGRLARQWHELNFIAIVSIKPPSNISPDASEVISKGSEPWDKFWKSDAN